MSVADVPEGEKEPKKRRGRPPSHTEQKRDQNITFRTSADLKSKLEEFASLSGRTVSQEIEYWLKLCVDQYSFQRKESNEGIEKLFGSYCAERIRCANEDAEKIMAEGKRIAMEKAGRMIDEVVNGKLFELVDQLAEVKATNKLSEITKRIADLEANFEKNPD